MPARVPSGHAPRHGPMIIRSPRASHSLPKLPRSSRRPQTCSKMAPDEAPEGHSQCHQIAPRQS
eukprot:9288878-Pyramimonas_sp.AAC.1